MPKEVGDIKKKFNFFENSLKKQQNHLGTLLKMTSYSPLLHILTQSHLRSRSGESEVDPSLSRFNSSFLSFSIKDNPPPSQFNYSISSSSLFTSYSAITLKGCVCVSDDLLFFISHATFKLTSLNLESCLLLTDKVFLSILLTI